LARPLLPVIAGLLLGIVSPAPGFAQSSGIRTYANQLDIDYKYNFEQLNEGVSYRSGADPVVVNHKGEREGGAEQAAAAAKSRPGTAARMAAFTRDCP
jgi:hypothetical protein